MKLFIDLDGYPNPGECFGSQRPDIVIINGKEVIVIELSVCYETRTEEKRRFQNLKSDLSIEWEKLNIIYVEITTLGFVSRNTKDFAKFVKPLGISYERMIGKCMETALRASFYIFTRRDKEWSNPEQALLTSTTGPLSLLVLMPDKDLFRQASSVFALTCLFHEAGHSISLIIYGLSNRF